MRVHSRAGFTMVEVLMTLSILGIIGAAAGGLLTMSFDAYSQSTDRGSLQREGLIAMERMTSGLRRSTFLLAPNHHTKSSNRLVFSGLVNDDGDFYFNDPLFPKYDEDVSGDLTEDAKNGLKNWDDDGDGSVDERAAEWIWDSSDKFDSVSYGNDDGNWPWPSDWDEVIESDGPSAGTVQITTGPGLDTYSLRIGGDYAWIGEELIRREVEVGWADGAWLSFELSQSGEVAGEIVVAVKGYGATWHELAKFPVGGTTQRKIVSLDVTGLTPYDSVIRISGLGLTGAFGYVYIDDLRLRTIFNGSGSWGGDDDEDGNTDEDPLDGIDNDLDGNIDEDPGNDSNADGAPGIAGIDDDGDGWIDEGDVNDDDEDGSLAELGLQPVIYKRDDVANTLLEYDTFTTQTVTLADHVTDFEVTHDSPSLVTIRLELTGDDGHVLTLYETVCLRNVQQKTGKRVR